VEYIASRNHLTCNGKIKYESSRQARRENHRITKGVKIHNRTEPDKLHEYLCVHCGHWHLGHALRIRETKKKLGILVPPKRKKFRWK